MWTTGRPRRRAPVPRDQVSGSCRRAADRVAGAAEQDPIELVADGLEAASVRADVVPLDQGVGCGVLKIDARLITRDDVAIAGGRPADERPGAVDDLDAVSVVAQVELAGGIDADVIPLDHGAR